MSWTFLSSENFPNNFLWVYLRQTDHIFQGVGSQILQKEDLWREGVGFPLSHLKSSLFYCYNTCHFWYQISPKFQIFTCFRKAPIIDSKFLWCFTTSCEEPPSPADPAPTFHFLVLLPFLYMCFFLQSATSVWLLTQIHSKPVSQLSVCICPLFSKKKKTLLFTYLFI